MVLYNTLCIRKAKLFTTNTTLINATQSIPSARQMTRRRLFLLSFLVYQTASIRVLSIMFCPCTLANTLKYLLARIDFHALPLLRIVYPLFTCFSVLV